MEQLNLTLTLNSNGSITANWSPITDVIRYHAYMYVRGEGHTIYNETNLMTTTYTSKPDLEANKQYTVVVVAYRPSGGNISEGKELLIRSDFYNNVPLSVPGNISAVADAASVTISFDKVIRATNYDILLNGSTVYNVTSSLDRVSKTINGLTPKTRYSYAVRAKNYYQTGEYSATKTFTTLQASPTAPTGIMKSVTQNSATISWNPVSNATSYEIIFNGVTYSQTATSKTFTGLTAGTSYKFKIRGNNSDAKGIYTNEITVTTAPQIPTGISATSTDTTVTVNWNAVSGVASYVVYFLKQDVTVPNTDTFCTFTNLTPDTLYTYKVGARSVDGESPYSAELTIRTLPPRPQTPTEVTQKSTENSVSLSWNAVSEATSYDVIFNKQNYHVTKNTVTINGLAANTNYTYQIRANNANGSSSYSDLKTVRTTPAPPSAPRVSATQNSVTISWPAVSGATSYDLWFNGTTYNVTGTSKTITGLTSGQSYNYQIRVNNADGSSSYSDTKTVTTIPPAPGVPTNISASVTYNSITIKWSAVSKAASYDVKLNNTVYNVTGTSKTITGLSANTSYSYQVRAKNTGGTSAYSALRTVKTLVSPPSVPVNISATSTTNSITVSWNAVSGATSYDVRVDNVVYNVTGTSKTITGLDPGTNYSYSVRAKNAGGSSAYSISKTIQTIPTIPSVPVNVNAAATEDSVTVSWDGIGGATSYGVLFNNTVYNVTGTSKKITGLEANTDYEYSVCAKNSVGDSAYSEVKTVRTLLTVPVGIQAVSTSNTVTVSWEPVSGATIYDINFDGMLYEMEGTSKEFTGLNSTTQYTFSIRARNEVVASEYSENYLISTKIATPEVPENVRATSTINSVTISWDEMERAEDYTVEFDGENSQVMAGGVRSVQLRAVLTEEEQSQSRVSKVYYGLEPNTEHTYRVRANNEGGSSAYSSLGTIKTQISKESTQPNGKMHKTYFDGKIPQLGMDPVNAITGAFLWSYTFLEDYGKDHLHFTVMYDSQRDEHSKVLGSRWTHSLNYLLYMDSEYIYFSTPYDEVIPFRKREESGIFQIGEGVQSHYVMSRNEDGTYSVKNIDGTEYIFNENLSLAQIMECGSATYKFDSDDQGQIIRIEGKYGKSLTLNYADGHIVSVADTMGNTVSFAYENDNLVSAASPAGGSMSFTYDDNARLFKISDFSGNDYLTNWYDTFGKVVAQSIAGRGDSLASYDTINRVTSFTDELGNITKYYYDENQNITLVELGETGIQRSYNENGQITGQTDALGNITQMLYDENGRMNRVIHPDGTEEQVAYNDGNYPIRIVNRDGTESLYDYDERNNLISAQNERGHVCTYAYDDNDNLVSYTDKEGNVWTYAYDENNHLEQAMDPEGNVSHYTHDAAGRLTAYTTPAGRTTSYQYSEAGDLLRIVDGDGSVIFEYDNNGNRTSITDKMGNRQRLEYNEMGQVSLATDFMGKEYRFVYDEKGNLTEETDPLGYSVSYTYDAMGNRVSWTDQNGGTTSFFFDGANQLTEIRNAAGGTVKYAYDTMGQVKTVTDSLEHQTVYAYDNAGRITGITNALGHSVSYTYDQAGNLLTKTDEDGAVTIYTYDKENRLLTIQTDAGTTSFTYDKSGRVISVQDTEENTEQAHYDEDGNLTKVTDKEGSQTTYVYDNSGRLSEETAPDGGKTVYAYDKNGNCIKITDAEDNEYTYAYDANNHLVKVTDPLENETSYVYDDRGQLISVTDAKGGETEFVYDGNGNLIRETNPLGGEKTYVYDSLNRLLESTDEEGNKSTYAYDAAGNMISYTDANQNSWSYTYDAGNRLTCVTNQNEDSLTYVYTNTGRIARVTDEEGAETDYQYDSMGRLLCLSDAQGNSLSFTYDSLGRILTQTDACGNTTEYEYSPTGNLLSVKEPEGGKTAYTYNAAGQVLTKEDALGNVTAYEYDALGQVTAITDAMGARTFFTYTANGQIATVTNAEGGITWYTYDACGNLTQTVNSLGAIVTYEYDAMNNQIRECLTASGEQTCATLYQYDKKGQMIKEINPLLEEKAYTYDGNGNMTSILDEDGNETNLRYDLNNRPVFMGYSDGKEASFRYNKRGELVEIRDWNGVTAMERDVLGRLTKVTDHEGRSVGYGYDSAGKLTGITYPDGSIVSYTYDRNRRLTKVTDAEGKATQYTYDLTGRLTSLSQPGSMAAYLYNANGLPTQARYQMEEGTFMEESLSYDVMGRITGCERQGGSPALAKCAAYTYDSAGQLLSYREGQTTETYSYDLLGNRISRKIGGNEQAAYRYNALNQLTAMTENGREYSYRYDRRGNLTEERRDGVPVRRYGYDATNHMVLGKNLETGEKTEYGYNALYMRVKNVQTLTGRDALRTRETSYVPEYLSATNNELMAYEKGFGITRSIYGRGYERLSQKVAAEPGTESMPVETAIAANAIGKSYFQPDIYGSPLFATDGQGQVLGYVDRGIWGDAKVPVHGDFNLSGLTESLRFTSYCYDPVIGKYFAQARFYDSTQGRMLSKDPVKRGLNSYRYCDNDPVDYVDPTGEIANILIGGFLGGVVGGAFGFAGSAVSQLMRRKRIDFRKARGAAANGAVVGAVKGALVGSGVGLPLAMAADFTAGTIGSALEQKISEGVVDVRKSITSGLTNAVSGAIYGNSQMKSLGQAFRKGAAAGGVTSGINYLSDILGSKKEEAGDSSVWYRKEGAGVLRERDPRRGCGTPNPFTGSMGYGSDYGYQYNVPAAGGESQNRKRFSFVDFGKEVLNGIVTGGLASAAFYGAGKAVGALKESIRKSGSGLLKEETFTRYLADGRQVTDVRNLPGNTGIEMSRRLTTEEMTFLTQEYGVEFAQVYKYGNGVNGGGGQYYLYSGTVDRVTVPIGNEIMLINHTHPSGTAFPSPADKVLLGRYQQLGSPQRSSEIIPIGKENIRFNTTGLIRGE